MTNLRKPLSILLFCLGIAHFELTHCPSLACAQNNDAAAMMSTKFVPNDALAIVVASPAQLLQNLAFELLPIEVFRVQLKDETGIDPADVSLVKAVVGLAGNGQPQFGIAIELSNDIDFQTLMDALSADPNPMKVGTRSVHEIEGPPGTVLCQVDPRTLYIGMAEYLDAMLSADAGSVALPSLLRTMPERPGLNAALAMESIRPMVSDFAIQQSAGLAPDLQPLAEVPALTDAVQVHFDFDDESLQFELTLIGIDDSSAKRIESILNDSLLAARELGVAEVRRSMASSGQSDEMRAATGQYADRIADRVIKTLSPQLKGDRVVIAIDAKTGVAGTGMIAGVLLPTLGSVHFAMPRTDVSNNFKQVLLGIHNYHSAYTKLPPSAITDANGKPLLSWRVAILPFVEEQALYQQFRLDEPWDSEHNLPLSKQLPAVYSSPRSRLTQGETVVQAIVGDEIGMRPLEKTGFRDFLDGLSNSVLIVEVNPDAAVPWSKPTDVEIDLDDPLANLTGTPDNGFYVGMADGAVNFVTDEIAPELFKAMLTRAGKEVIEPLR